MFENITTSLKKFNNLKKKFFFLKEINMEFQRLVRNLNW